MWSYKMCTSIFTSCSWGFFLIYINQITEENPFTHTMNYFTCTLYCLVYTHSHLVQKLSYIPLPSAPETFISYQILGYVNGHSQPIEAIPTFEHYNNIIHGEEYILLFNIIMNSNFFLKSFMSQFFWRWQNK